MGKPTGFLEYERMAKKRRDPKERLKDFEEFYLPVSEEERRAQGARCMDCGVPFCQSGMMLSRMMTGCPLHNLIPEWNDDIYRGQTESALKRLIKTNNFPEFTGRVCPALCEAACTNGMCGESVTVHDNELYIIESGFENGWIKPRPPKARSGKRVAVIGSGPSGLAVADTLNRRGHSVTVYEKSDRIGGLLMYGIPNMKLSKRVVERRLALMKEEGVTFCPATEIREKKEAERLRAEYDAIVLCCGANQPRDIRVPGRDAEGVYFAVDFLTANTKSLLDSGFEDHKYIDPKGKNVVIVGGGDTGNDCVGTVLRHGAKSVTQLEMMPMPPTERTPGNPWPEFPRVLKTDYGQEEAIALFGKDPRVYETTVKEIIKEEGRIKAIRTVKVKFCDGKLCEVEGTEETLPAELLILAAGFVGTRPELPAAFGVSLTERGAVQTKENGFETNVPGVFAAGDMHIGQSLVVRAISEGRQCAKEVDLYLMGYTNLI